MTASRRPPLLHYVNPVVKGGDWFIRVNAIDTVIYINHCSEVEYSTYDDRHQIKYYSTKFDKKDRTHMCAKCWRIAPERIVETFNLLSLKYNLYYRDFLPTESVGTTMHYFMEVIDGLEAERLRTV